MAEKKKSFFEKMRERYSGDNEENQEPNIEDRPPLRPDVEVAQERHKRLEAMYGPEEYEEMEEFDPHRDVDGIVGSRFRYEPEAYDDDNFGLEYEEIEFLTLSGSTLLDKNQNKEPEPNKDTGVTDP